MADEWIERRDDGRYDVRFPDDVRALLAGLAANLHELLQTGGDDPSTVRLFPPAYVNEDAFNDDYQRLMHDDLVQARLARAGVLEHTATAADLSEEELTSWMSALNDLRLILGTRLDISEESYDRLVPEDDPRAPELYLYSLLTHIQEEVVQALAG